VTTTVDDTPTLDTPNLVVRSPEDADARPLARVANSWAVARSTESLPHPFSPEHARAWISQKPRGEYRFVMIERASERIVGAIGLYVRHEDWETGFWVAKEFWNRGYATEALRAVAVFAFDELAIAKLTASAFVENKAAARVLDKCGFRRLGDLPELLPERGGKRLLGWYVLDRDSLIRS